MSKYIKYDHDHLGNAYKSEYAMCRHYGVNWSTFRDRMRSGWSLEQALTQKSRTDVSIERGFRKKNGCYLDHLENPYTSIRTMCKCWHISTSTFYCRFNAGNTLEYSLTHKNKIEVPDKDETVIWVFGEPYAQYADIDKAYGFSGKMAYVNKDNLEEWLTQQGKYFIDGRLFSSTSELAEAYGKTEACIYNRLNVLGWSLDDAVHRPSMHGSRAEECEDHLGNKYPSKKDMVAAYHISYCVYVSRIRSGWNLKDTLTTPVRRHNKHAGNIEEALA